MKGINFPNATRHLGAPAGWDPAKHGECDALPIQDMNLEGMPAMRSVWKPTEVELARLNAGANVELVVIGTRHPPVAVRVIAAG